MFIGFYLFAAGLFTVAYGSLVDPEPTLLLTGAAMMGMPAFMPAECNDGKVREFKITRDTDLREVAWIEDPINQQVQKDLKKLGMHKPPPNPGLVVPSRHDIAMAALGHDRRGRIPGEVWKKGEGWVRLDEPPEPILETILD